MRTLWRFIAGFFKWTWRVLNFVREMVLNLFFIFLVLVGVGIWMQIGNGSNSEPVSYTHLRAHETARSSRMPSSA